VQTGFLFIIRFSVHVDMESINILKHIKFVILKISIIHFILASLWNNSDQSVSPRNCRRHGNNCRASFDPYRIALKMDVTTSGPNMPSSSEIM
jgi:hypothetical protein